MKTRVRFILHPSSFTKESLMPDPTIQRLRDEIAQLEQAIPTLAAMPLVRASLQQQRDAKMAELARLERAALGIGSMVDQSGQTGGVSAGTGNQFTGPTHIGDRFKGSKISGPVIGNVQSGRDTPIAGGDQTIIQRSGEPVAPTPPASPVSAVAPRTPIADPTLSADGIHFSFGHALVIGVGQYRDPGIPNVATTANDARVLGALLRDPQAAAYPDAQVRVLVDAKATRTSITAALSELAQRAVGGTALIFFAGHGEAVDGSYCLLPSDADVHRLAATSIDAALFHQLVAEVRSQAKRLVVLLNCCHAGGVGDAVLDASGALLSGSAPPTDFYRPLAVGSGQVVISSSRPAQKAGARSHANPQHTTFGTHLLAALRGNVPGDGPAVRVFELFAALCASVPADARHINYQGAPLQQEPLFYASQLDDNLAVALRPGWQGGTLSSDVQHQAHRLVELELQMERTNSDPVLRGERDALLRALGVA
ncbi:MAG: caspase family protein [Candidatus Viridilinea halotolerans]|uniref:Caspase family protein n=1 Tax=Candidatus Viridilinea halotolerans TaxID=2491704 RepID=A0A426TYB1_9CHLR|nr:MAG: caspase family protein [Candidatus Viridilinea halotolerans]